MRAVFDFDDTICYHNDRDRSVDTARPIALTVDKMRRMKRDGWEIVIYTARGQKSCGGDLAKIEAKYRSVIEEWLARYEVPYDELLFGKPLGDLYVDDKGVGLDKFCSMDMKLLKGNSGSSVYKCGQHVLKMCPDAYEQASWYKQAETLGVNVPYVYSVVLRTLDMSWIRGRSASDEFSAEDVIRVLGIVKKFSAIKAPKFNVEALIARAQEHLGDRIEKFDSLFGYFRENRETYEVCSSFCHGDLSLSNIIIDNRTAYLIDPIVRPEYSSYLMDLAKLKFSVEGGEEFLHRKTARYEEAAQVLNRELEEEGIKRDVEALQAIYWIRLLKYTEPGRQGEVITKAAQLQHRVVWS